MEYEERERELTLATAWFILYQVELYTNNLKDMQIDLKITFKFTYHLFCASFTSENVTVAF